jgi:uncharacterized lipoprotein YajG
MKTRSFLHSGLCALCVLCGSLLLTGCSDDPATRIHRAAKVASISILVEDPNKDDNLERIANRVDQLLAASSLTDAMIAELANELVSRGDIDRREAMAIALVAQELWVEFRPKDGVLPLDKPKVRAALMAFTAGIRDGVTFSRAFPPAPSPSQTQAAP